MKRYGRRTDDGKRTQETANAFTLSKTRDKTARYKSVSCLVLTWESAGHHSRDERIDNTLRFQLETEAEQNKGTKQDDICVRYQTTQYLCEVYITSDIDAYRTTSRVLETRRLETTRRTLEMQATHGKHAQLKCNERQYCHQKAKPGHNMTPFMCVATLDWCTRNDENEHRRSGKCEMYST